jgi:hypothetical protein
MEAMARRSDWLCFALLAIATIAACGKDAQVLAPKGSLAVGAYAPIAYNDTCDLPGGKVPMPPSCIPHEVTELLELSASDPSVFEVVKAEDTGLGADAIAANYLVGRGPGEATLSFKGRFDDGSVRQATTTVRVKTPDTLKMLTFCDDWSSATTLVLPVQTSQEFAMAIYAGDEQLAGWMPNAVTATGVTQNGEGTTFADRPYFVWQAPDAPVALQLQSAYVSHIIGSLTAFALDQVTDIILDVYQESYRNAFTEPGNLFVATNVGINGQASCRHYPVDLHTSTPAICSGAAGETDWPGDKFNGVVTVHAEGICTLTASWPKAGVTLVPGPVPATRSFPVFLVNQPPSGAESFTSGGACTVAGETVCLNGRAGVGLCTSGHWVEQPHCPSDQVCDYLPGSSLGCTSGAVCAGCRALRQP